VDKDVHKLAEWIAHEETPNAPRFAYGAVFDGQPGFLHPRQSDIEIAVERAIFFNTRSGVTGIVCV